MLTVGQHVFFEVHSRFTCLIFTFTVGSHGRVCVNSMFTFNRFSCTHSFARLCLAPHLWRGQKPLMLFSLFFVGHLCFNELRWKIEIKIRNVDPIFVKETIVLAKEEGLSEQVFLKNRLETLRTVKKEKKRIILTKGKAHFVQMLRESWSYLHNCSYKKQESSPRRVFF